MVANVLKTQLAATTNKVAEMQAILNPRTPIRFMEKTDVKDLIMQLSDALNETDVQLREQVNALLGRLIQQDTGATDEAR